jgi:2-succinyl-5-enolpyruvyl-6-hydroxy-3-cyclohexene-1-carboxylate synthase
VDLDVRDQRVLCVVGAGASPEIIAAARQAQWVVVGDATARESLAYADPLVRHDEIWSDLVPDVVIRIGGIPASKFLAQRLVTSGVEVIGLDCAGPVSDPDAVVSRRVAGVPDASNRAHVGDADYVALWRDASALVHQHLATLWDEVLDEVLVARLVVETSNSRQVSLVVGSSMPVRDVEWWSEARESAVYSNRGANGIDGVVSTFLGVAQNSRAIGLVGDVTMLHDVSALVDGPGANTSAVLVVSDNGGGGIFSFLAQAREVPAAEFETLFGTPRPHDLAVVAAAFGHHGETVSSAAQLRAALAAGLERPGLSVVVATVPTREANVARHEELNALVARWWASR